MKFNPFCMCCAVGKQEQNIRSFQDMDKKVEYMKKVMDRMANIAEEDCAPSVSVELKLHFFMPVLATILILQLCQM